MQMDNFVVGLDIGTQYIKASALSLQDNTLMYGAAVESQGIDRNGITDVKALGSAIRKVVGKLEVKISRNIHAVFVCLQPETVGFLDAEGSVVLSGDLVTQSDIDKAMDAAQLVTLAPDEEIVDLLISRYLVDDTAYRDPSGVRGTRLEIRAQLVTAKRPLVESLYDAVAAAKLKVAGTGLGIEGASSILITPQDRKNGVFLVDAGANTTRIVLYKDNRIVDQDVIRLGGKSITRDLSIVLKISLLEAEELKKGYSKGEFTDDVEKAALVEEVIKARVEEIMAFVQRFVSRYEEDQEIRKVVVYGGGLCGFRHVNNLFKSTLNKSTNFVTSDIIRDDSLFNVPAGGLAYHIVNSVHYKSVVGEFVKDDEETQEMPSSDRQEQDDFLRKYQDTFRTSGNVHADDEDEDDEDEDIGVFEKIASWINTVKSKWRKR
ncbi:hypothetical protein KCG48_04280 [Proteiniclasticum sp. BAD-10]|uniref:SHS2 domain-containing protein n=2 Tax=Proteiniclasticum sediminis TaxID=2804028 RepID=A0A941CMS7_9CLOT|nr:hypothetical protein [Proteiniclasticum sediminis]